MVFDPLQREITAYLQLTITQRVPKLSPREQIRKMRADRGSAVNGGEVRRHHLAIVRPELTGGFSVRTIHRSNKCFADSVNGDVFVFDRHKK